MKSTPAVIKQQDTYSLGLARKNQIQKVRYVYEKEGTKEILEVLTEHYFSLH